MSDDGGYSGPERREGGLTAQAEELSQNVADLNESVMRWSSYGLRNRHLIWWLGGVVVMVVAILVVLGFVVAQVNATSDEARKATSVAAQNKQNAKVSCLVGNESRAGQVRLWNYVLDAASATPGQPPAQKKLIADFRVYINEIFAPRDCDNPATVVTTPTPPALPTPTR